MATREEAIEENLEHYCMETDYAEFTNRNADAVERFLPYMKVKSVVDLGCGDGAAYAAFDGCDYLGIDVNPVKLARHRGETVKQDMYTWLSEQSDNSVENVFSHHALEHTVEPWDIIQEIYRVLKPGGACFITVPRYVAIGAGEYSSFEGPENLVPGGAVAEILEVNDIYPEIKALWIKP